MYRLSSLFWVMLFFLGNSWFSDYRKHKKFPQKSRVSYPRDFLPLSVSFVPSDEGKRNWCRLGRFLRTCPGVTPLHWELCPKESFGLSSQICAQAALRRWRTKLLLQQVENDPLPFTVPGMEKSDGWGTCENKYIFSRIVTGLVMRVLSVNEHFTNVKELPFWPCIFLVDVFYLFDKMHFIYSLLR